ncbi:MetA-pathway of phenol degradation [Methylorubrum populi]
MIVIARILLAVAVSLGLAGASRAADPAARDRPPEEGVVKDGPFFLFADTQVSYRYQFPTVAPGVQIQRPDGSLRSREAPKQILNISHADAWAYGTNFFSLDILKSGSQFPAGTTNTQSGGPSFAEYGNTEAYGLYRGTLSLNALTGTKAFTLPGLVKEVSLAFGFDANSQNDAFGSKKRDIVGGLNFAFDVPAGFLNLSVHAYKEWNRNGFNTGPDRDQSFDTVPEFEIVYSVPLTFSGLPLTLAGFNTIVLPKGRGIGGNLGAYAFNPPRGLEFLSRTNLVLDLGKLVYDQPNKVDVFVGFQYWLNKFGNRETATFKGTEEKSFLAGIAFHIF